MEKCRFMVSLRSGFFKIGSSPKIFNLQSTIVWSSLESDFFQRTKLLRILQLQYNDEQCNGKDKKFSPHRGGCHIDIRFHQPGVHFV